MSKIEYLIRSAMRVPDPRRRACPNCGASASQVVERKFAVTALRRCTGCHMMFRTPVDDPAEASEFYNSDYTQGFTTDLPSLDELERLKAANFAGGEKDYSYYIGVLRELGLRRGDKLFDFGCSWGYGSYQFTKAGFGTLSYEISRPRGGYGATNLGVQLVPDFESWAEASPHSMDSFFSAHVLEHVPSPSRIIELARRVLKPSGLFVAFFPNGSAPARRAVPGWSGLWGEVHPNFLDDEFMNRAVSDRPRLFGSSPVVLDAAAAKHLRGTGAEPHCLNDLTGDELLFAFRT